MSLSNAGREEEEEEDQDNNDCGRTEEDDKEVEDVGNGMTEEWSRRITAATAAAEDALVDEAAKEGDAPVAQRRTREMRSGSQRITRGRHRWSRW